jgi:hypothetical protein
MSNVLSLCSTVGANTGAIDCDITRGNPQVIIAGSKTFAPADYATQAAFKAAFQSALKLAAGSSSKLFPFPPIQGVSDKTEAGKEGTLGYGLKVKLLRSKPGYEFDVLAGSALEKALIKFDGKALPLFIFDDQGQIWGTADDAGNFSGATYLIGVEPRGFGDANNAKVTKITISIVDATDFVENAAVIQSTIVASELKGLNDVTLSERAGHTAGVFHIKAEVITAALGGNINIYDKYPDEIAAAGVWTAKNVATGAAITITGVAKDTTHECWDVTVDATMYAALGAGDKILFNLADPATLDAADIVGIEGTGVVCTK